MTYRIALPVIAAFLLSGTLSEQGAGQTARELTTQQMPANASSSPDALTETVDRYIACRRNLDADCMTELADREFYEDSGLTSYDIGRQIVAVLRSANPRMEYSVFEAAQRWEPITSGERLVSFVPYYESYNDEPEGQRYERMGFLLSSSDDDGETWRLVKVEGSNLALATDYIEREYPGIVGRPLPPVVEQNVREPPMAQRRSVRTTERKFVMVGDGFVYAMKWEIRAEIEGALNVAIYYENPADRSQPLGFYGSLEPGQQVLEWQSPVLTAFEPGERYAVVVEISEPDTEDVLFGLQQWLLFQPTREMWRALLAQPPASTSEVAPRP